MRIGILTRRLPPEICGIGDHTLELAKSLEPFGVEVIILASLGNSKENVKIISDDYTASGLTALNHYLVSLHLDLLVLQFTPYLYSYQGLEANTTLYRFWLRCSQKIPTAIIVHEMYYQKWWDPRSWLRGEKEKSLVRQLTGISQRVFCASDLLLKELRRWHPHQQVEQLPISSNVPYNPLSQTERQNLRQAQGIAPEDHVIILFGAGNSLVPQWVEGLDCYLYQRSVSVRWLVLGGLSPHQWRLRAPVLKPGFLEPKSLSSWLQLGDLFYVPHICGVCAKRTTIAAALQHGLPLVGTRGFLTDKFWTDVPGVSLVPVGQQQMLYEAAYVACKEKRSIPQGETQAYYEQHLSWPVVAHRFLATVKSA